MSFTKVRTSHRQTYQGVLKFGRYAPIDELQSMHACAHKQDDLVSQYADGPVRTQGRWSMCSRIRHAERGTTGVLAMVVRRHNTYLV